MSRFQLGEFWLSQQRRSGQWCRTWYDRKTRQTRRASLGTRDAEEAKVRLAEWFVREAELRDLKPADVPVPTVLERYYAQHGAALPSKDTAKRAVALWNEFWDDATVADLSVQRQREFVAWLAGRGLSDGYVRRVVGVGKAALNRAYEHQEIREVPFVRLEPAGSTYDRRATVEQLAAFLSAVPPELEHVFTYAMIRLNTGCRGDAARDLQPFQCDFAHRLVRLNPEGRRQTKKRRPVVPMTDTLASVLQGMKVEAFYVHWHGKRVGSIRRAWSIVRTAAGLPAWFAPKVLRHTVATELRKRGVPGWEVSGLLGHTRGDAEATTAAYAKYDPAFLGNARRELDAWMSEIAKTVPRLRSHATHTQRAKTTGKTVVNRGTRRGPSA